MRLLRVSFCLVVAAGTISCSSLPPPETNSPAPSEVPITPPSVGPSPLASPVPPSPTPSKAAPTPSTSTPPPNPPTPSPTPSGIQPTWTQIPTTGGVTPHWSPGGSYLLFEEQQEVSGLTVVDAAGQQVGSYDGYLEPTWLTDDEFVAYKQSSMPSNPHHEVDAPAIIVDVRDRTTTYSSFPCCLALGNGHGSAAVLWFLQYLHGVPQPQFSVWSNGTLTDPQPGFPIVWSPAGDTLVVAHPDGPGRSTNGWMEAFAWPGLTTVVQGNGTTVVDLAARFSPSGAHITPASVIDSSTGSDDDLGVLALATGAVAAIPTVGNQWSFAWDGADELLLSDDTGLTIYSPDGTRLGHEAFSGWVTGSADGSTVLVIDPHNVPSLWPSGGTIALPTTADSETEFWLSPTGGDLLVSSNGGFWLAQLP